MTKNYINENAAMYKSNQPTLKDFYDFVLRNPKHKKSYFQIAATNIRIPSDTIVHDKKKHTLSYAELEDFLLNLDNIVSACISRKTINGGPAYLMHVKGKVSYGAAMGIARDKCVYFYTIFVDHPNSIDNWIKEEARTPSAAQPPSSSRHERDSVALLGLASQDIITDIKELVKYNTLHSNELVTEAVSVPVYYHGSNNKFTTFDKSKIKENKLGLCFNFTDDIDMAYQYGDNILTVNLDLNNPITEDILDQRFPYEGDCIFGELLGFPPISKEDWEKDNETFADMLRMFKMKPEFIKTLQKLGFDGFAFPDEHHYGVFEPEQIHIIEDNNMNENLTLSKPTRKYIDSLKFTNKEYITFENRKPYPNCWTETGLIELDGETWKFYSCTKSMGRENVVWNLVNEKDEIISLKTPELDMLLGEHGENLNEKLEEIGTTMYATPSAFDVINLMKNKGKPYRVVYDTNLRYYFIGDAYNYIHQDLLEGAFRNGFYPDMVSEGEIMDYTDNGMYNEELLLFAFSPDEGKQLDMEKSSDGYTRKYVYDFGVIYAHEMTPLENFDLWGLLKEPISKENIFENEYAKLNSLLEAYVK